VNYSLSYTAQALNDIENILDFLSEIQADLPRSFRNELAIQLEKLDEQPERWSELSNGIRAIRLRLSKRLTYYVFYHFLAGERKILLLRLIPQQADPQQWPS
jgi:plasmid stabilization system protein ParE